MPCTRGGMTRTKGVVTWIIKIKSNVEEDNQTENQDKWIVAIPEPIIQEDNVDEINDDNDDDFQNPPPKSVTVLRFKTKAAIKKSNARKSSTGKEGKEDAEMQGRKKLNKGKRKLNFEQTDEDAPQSKTRKKKKSKTGEEVAQGKASKRKNQKADEPESEVKTSLKKNKKEKKTPKKKNSKEDKKEVEKIGYLKIRNSPSILSETNEFLSTKQQDWVKNCGFGSLFDFTLQSLPQRLGKNILEAFEANSCSLKLLNDNIPIIDDDVNDVLGLSFEGESIRFVSKEDIKERIHKWTSQFNANDETLILASKVVEKIKEGKDDDNFQMLFLIIMTNVLIQSNTNSYVDRTFLSFDGDLDECGNYNWAEYLLQTLVRTRANWQKKTKSIFFTKPLVFLTLLYVDRVRYRFEKLVDRQLPSYKGWTKEKLKERQSKELSEDGFGTGAILPPARLELSKKNQLTITYHSAEKEKDKENGAKQNQETEVLCITVEQQQED